VRSPVHLILSWTFRHRSIVVAAAVCLAIVAVVGASGLRFDADVLSLLPRGGRAVPAFRDFIESFGSVDHLYVVFTAPPQHSMAEYEDLVNQWTVRLRQAPEIARVDTGQMDDSRDLSWLADRRLLLLDDERLQDALGRFTGDGLRKALQSRRLLLAVPSPAVANLVRHDPLATYDLLRDQLGGTQAGINLGVTEGGYGTADGRSRLLIAKPVKPPFDVEFSHALARRIDAVRAEVDRAAGTGSGTPRPDEDEVRPPPLIEIAGGHRIAIETEAVIRRESISNSITSLALILPLLYAVFRSGWLVVVGPLPAALSLMLTLGLLGAAGTTLSTAATASAAMLFGLGVDGVVLLYISYTNALKASGTSASALERLRGAASSMLLGMWTTAATFYGLVFVDFPSLEQLGSVIGHSMVICGLVTLILVPALLPRAHPSRSIRSLTMPRFARWIEQRRSAILVAALAATLLLAAASTQLRINPTLDRLRSVTPGAVLLQRIGPMFGISDDVSVVMARGSDLDALLVANERLRARLAQELPGLAVQAPTQLLPSASTQARRQDLVRRSGVSATAAAAALASAESETGFAPGTFDPFRGRLPELLAARQLSIDGYRAHGLDDLIGRFITRSGDQWRLATYAFPDGEEQTLALQRIAGEVEPAATVTGLPIVNRELAERFLPAFVKGLTIGTVVVVALVFIAFRDWRMMLLSLAPTAIGLVWAAGLLALAGATLDLFALFAVVTFVGIGVDYGVHLVHRLREHGDAEHAVAELAPVILVAGAITLAGYGTLVTSSYPPLRSIGMVSMVSVVTLAGSSLLVLPALLPRRQS
jgi:predicted exporter